MSRKWHVKQTGRYATPAHSNKPPLGSYMPTNPDSLPEAVGKAIAASRAAGRIKQLTNGLEKASGDKAIRIGLEIRNLEFLAREAEKIKAELIRRAVQTPSSAAETAMLLSERGEHSLLSDLGRAVAEKCDEPFWNGLLKEKYAGPLLAKIVMGKINYQGLFADYVAELEASGRKDVLLELAIQIAKLKEGYDIVVNTMYLRRFHHCYMKLDLDPNSAI